MTTPSAPQHGRLDPGPAGTASERRRLTNLAYRLLGSLADAEDVVQETYARWYAMPAERRAAVVSPGGWLTKVAGRVCLDLLGSARVRRERYVGEWLPEPLPDRAELFGGRLGGSAADAADPADQVTMDESVHMAFLVVLESTTPAERVAFVLHDVFRYPFPEVAEIVGRSPAACRKLASSARRRVRTAQRPAAAEHHAALVREFRRAWAAKDIGALVGLLDPAAVSTPDSGGLVPAVLRPIVGSEAIARGLAEVREQQPGIELLERTVNGQPGLMARLDGVPVSVLAFDVADGRITRIWAMRNPEKLRAWTAA
ncbi:RNA polymerase sigma factor SigJ [Streptomyces sp. CMB-StM0423]|uniref:RNA polymerase sigma factor SigJ n=1 Tax=Streptomyces sp. CMB-StM0423 TaxID=2059884 RepID=UPI000C705629|nr:RNA polymerase sigma factor SigJ [Streptomyces sp. CMB-StM0423]AUH39399.1 RNA polymerase subunit sigma-24 [Streptomyces sp. CMB-StM0423]